MKRISIIGGGTGLSVLLRGLKKKTEDLHAIVNMVDDGGSSGRIRDELGMGPPGDLRNCLLAMSEADPLLDELFNYRFDQGSLSGQSMGNLIIAALSKLTGGIDHALYQAASIFNVNGHVYPVTLEDIRLFARLQNGREIIGEAIIPQIAYEENSPIEYVNLHPMRPKAFKEVIPVIESSDIVLVGPGSLYTSLLPALLVSGVKEAILRSKGVCIYTANLMTQAGETDHLAISDHLRVLQEHLEDNIFDGIVINNRVLQPDELKLYELEHAEQILPTPNDRRYFQERGIEVAEGDLVCRQDTLIRHNFDLTSDIIMDLAQKIKDKK